MVTSRIYLNRIVYVDCTESVRAWTNLCAVRE